MTANGGGQGPQPVVSAKVRGWIAVGIFTLFALSVLSGLVAIWQGKDAQFNPWMGVVMVGTGAAIFGDGFLRGIDRR